MARNGSGKKEEEGIREIARGGKERRRKSALKRPLSTFSSPPLPFFYVSSFSPAEEEGSKSPTIWGGADRSKNWVFLRENGLLCRFFLSALFWCLATFIWPFCRVKQPFSVPPLDTRPKKVAPASLPIAPEESSPLHPWALRSLSASSFGPGSF